MTMETAPRRTEEVPSLPARPPTMHKGQAGRVAIIAGSRGMSGAAILSALGALRGGAGLVRVYCPQSIQPIVAAAEPCLMTVPLPEVSASGTFGEAAAKQAAESLDWASAAGVGPGLGDGDYSAKFLIRLGSHWNGAAVFDADALNVLARFLTIENWWEKRRGVPTIITPHPGEMARLRVGAKLPPLAGDDDDTRLRIAHEYACLAQCVVVLKGHRTVVCTPDEAYINTTGNPGMATGGMGDVLTGLIAALLGQGLPPFDAARLGVYVHGLAANHCQRDIGPVGYLARDVADALPRALGGAAQARIGFR